MLLLVLVLELVLGTGDPVIGEFDVDALLSIVTVPVGPDDVDEFPEG
jgi:hypothetical protein